jgi:hypothetical protein
MTPESQELLDALIPADGAVTTDITEEIYGLIEPLHAILDRVDTHLQEIDRLRRAADRAENDPKVYGWFERFKQTVDAGRRINGEAKRGIEAISDLCFQLDGYATEMRDTLERKYEAAMANPRVVLSKNEHDHLKAVAQEANDRLADALARVNELEDKQGKGK